MKVDNLCLKILEVFCYTYNSKDETKIILVLAVKFKIYEWTTEDNVYIKYLDGMHPIFIDI